jgi:hypothetical protein
MAIMIKSRQSACVLIAAISISLLPLVGFAKVKPIMTTDLLQHLKKGEPWDRGVLTATKMVMFQQAASGGTDATSVAKITLAYFTSSDCTGSKAGTGFYTTPDGTSFPISVGTAFGLVAASAWNVGSTKLSIVDMTAIHSIAVTLKSTNNNTPQANFSNVSFACVQNVDCTAGPSGQCTSGSSTQSFTLKTTVAIGDPADGGVIACLSGGPLNVIAASGDIITVNNCWSPTPDSNITTSNVDGQTNTTTIVNQYGTADPYAARSCNEYSSIAGGYSSGWFLPAIDQLSCLYTNRTHFTFAGNTHWASTQFDIGDAYTVSFNNSGTINHFTKSTTCNGRRVHCARAMG